MFCSFLHYSRRLHYPVSVAPMVGRTDRHYRYFVRLMSKEVLLYTEMQSIGAILRGPRDHLLTFSPAEAPVVLQLAGSCKEGLQRALHQALPYGYQEINLNVGCPSAQVQKASYGAILMKTPPLVAELLAAMQTVSSVPITVKHRIGVDHFDSYTYLKYFVETLAEKGVRVFIVHARKALLEGLSPKENRQIPPLKYEFVYQLKQDFPQLHIELNGGIRSLQELQKHYDHVDSMMLGRVAYEDPSLFLELDSFIQSLRKGTKWMPLTLSCQQRSQEKYRIIRQYWDYIENWHEEALEFFSWSSLVRPLYSFLKGERGTGEFKRCLNRCIVAKIPPQKAWLWVEGALQLYLEGAANAQGAPG